MSKPVKNPRAVAKAPVAAAPFQRPIAMNVAPSGAAVLTIFGYIGDWATTLESFDEALQRAGNVSSLTVRINSGGGDAFEGMGIHAYIKALPYPTKAEILGLAASAASIIAVGCDTVSIPKAGQLMIHQARIPTLNAGEDDLDEAKAMLVSLNAAMATAYADKTGQSQEDVAALMKTTTWMGAEQALELGFVDEISDADVVDPTDTVAADGTDPNADTLVLADVATPATATAAVEAHSDEDGDEDGDEEDGEDEGDDEDEDEDDDDQPRDDAGRFTARARAVVEATQAYVDQPEVGRKILAHASTVFPAVAVAAALVETASSVAASPAKRPKADKRPVAGRPAKPSVRASTPGAPAAAVPPPAPIVCPVAMAEACAEAGDATFARDALKSGLSVEAAVTAIGLNKDKLALAARFRAVATHIAIDDAAIRAAADLDAVRKLLFEAMVSDEPKIDTTPQAAAAPPKAQSEQLSAAQANIRNRFFPGRRA